MSSISFENMTIKDIQELQSQANKHLESRKKMTIAQLRKKIRQLIKDEGLNLSDIFPGLPDEPTISTVEPKYRNPEDETQTWTGRGRTPRWLQKKLDDDHEKEEYLIQK